MIKINDKVVDIGYFPDGTLLLKEDPTDFSTIASGLFSNGMRTTINWNYENNEELVVLIFLTKHLRRIGFNRIELKMPYIPNARQDRVKSSKDVFTLKYFAEIINYLNFDKVTVLDPHSSVSEALINNLKIVTPYDYIKTAFDSINEKCVVSEENPLIVFFPDEGAMKRYSDLFNMPYAFGIKKRDWNTGKILGLDVSGATDKIKGSRVLIVDDICSRGGTFYHSAKKLKELGAKEIYLYVSHCENTILNGDLIYSTLVEKIYTTDSIFTKKHEKIEVIHFD